jgi:hypothetical protein
MKELRLHYPLPLVSRVLDVSASGYYAWLDRPLSQRAREELRLEIEIIVAHKRTRQVYGAEKWHAPKTGTAGMLVLRMFRTSERSLQRINPVNSVKYRNIQCK